MSNSLRVYLFVSLIVFLGQSAYGQLNLFAPQIIGQQPTPLITKKNTHITIALGDLRVTDADIFAPEYPKGYTLKVFPGDHYTLVNFNLTPENNFVGILTVQVQVNDGQLNSNIFNLKIDVTNLKPVITDHQPISIKEGENFTLLLSHLTVKDDDNKYPGDFTLTVFDGANYSINGNTIIPSPGFAGKLKVPVSVNDGHEDSDKFDVIIEARNNIKPTITDQAELKTNPGTKITIKLENLTVNDPDDADYPTGFTLKLYDESNNYSISGSVVTPSPSFTGKLTVPISVNDGIDESNKYNLIIEVNKKVNVRPIITAQDALSTNEDKTLTVRLNNLKVTDPDDTYPDGFSLKMYDGVNHTVAGSVVKPNPNFFGKLEVTTTVSDGEEFSEPFTLQILVQPVNDVPVIKGQSPVKIIANTPSEIMLTSLTVEDPDGPAGSNATVKILSGTNYTFSGATITPATNFTGTLTVRVVVNDGIADSAPFNLSVEVLPISVIPLITGQQALLVNEDESITLKFDNLTVIDEDNPYPTGFTIIVSDGPNYTFNNLTITPSPNFNSFLSVNVKVFDGKNLSNPYPLKIYVIPMNDAPEITELEDTALPYEPGTGPILLTEIFDCIDVDDLENGYLSFAEIGFRDTTFRHLNDVLIFNNVDTADIRGIYESGRGVLSLIGYATVAEYKKVIRSIQYNYQLTEDENGNQSEVVPGPKYIYFKINDGHLESDTVERIIKIESSVSLDIPNAFTPNADPFNKTWKIRSIGDAHRFDKAIIKVYNKRGVLVYESKGLDKAWDGSFNGEALPVDTYYYTIDLNLSYAQKTYKGAVMILR